MFDSVWPTAAKIISCRLAIAAHTRGAGSPEGAGTWSRGSGSMFVGRLSVAPMTVDNALTVRAFFHGLRGRGGSFYLTLPGTESLSNASYSLAGSTAAGSVQATMTATLTGTLPVAGSYALFGNPSSTGQLVQVISVSDKTITFRPPLRNTQSTFTSVQFGQFRGLFRLSGETPIIAIRPYICPGFDVEFEDFR